MDRIVIIGNGKGVLKAKKREFVDSSTVVRINNFKIEGFEDYVGTRTDIYSCSPRYIKYIDLTDLNRLSICEQNFKEAIEKHPEVKGKLEELKESFFRIYTPPKIDSSKVEILYLFMDDFKFDQNYSTGMRTILYCLDRFNVPIYITGFDNFLSSGWYWDDVGMADRFARTQNYTDGHPYLIERNKIKELINGKRITEI